jgi:hypothetical protein
MTIASVRFYYYCENESDELQINRTHWGFAKWFERRLKPIKNQLKGPEAKGVDIINFMAFDNAEKAWRLNEWGQRMNSFEFDFAYNFKLLQAREPIENIKELMKFTSSIALCAPWPQVVAVGEALAVPLSSQEQESLLPYLRWPRDKI